MTPKQYQLAKVIPRLSHATRWEVHGLGWSWVATKAAAFALAAQWTAIHGRTVEVFDRCAGLGEPELWHVRDCARVEGYRMSPCCDAMGACR